MKNKSKSPEKDKTKLIEKIKKNAPTKKEVKDIAKKIYEKYPNATDELSRR